MILLQEDIMRLKNEVITVRRELHSIPEIGFQEYKTRDYIIKKLEEYKIDVFCDIAKTGVIGYIKGYEGNRTYAFRADMDALSVDEKTGLDFSSRHKGVMHACGHDGHMAILLGFAKYLSDNRNKIKENIVLIFQPAEEGPGGAKTIIDEGIIEKFKIERIYGLHLYPDVEEGKIGCRPGPLMAQNAELDIVIKGKSGHGAIPHMATDAILISGYLLSSLQSIISRSIDPNEGAVITIGKMIAGQARNIIAGEARLEGTLRAFKEEVYNRLKSRLVEIAKGLEIMHGCSIELSFNDMYPAVNNNQEMYYDLVSAVGRENIVEVNPQMTSEDFSFYQRVIPGIFFFLGVRNEEKGYTYPLHNPCFDFNEDNMLIGIQVYVNLLKHINGLDN